MSKKKYKKVRVAAKPKFEVEPEKLYETTFKHKYKVGDRVELKYDEGARTIKGVGLVVFDNPMQPGYAFEERGWAAECDIVGLAPRSLLSREEKHLLREEIQRAYDRWDECPEIINIAKLEHTTYSTIHLEDNNCNWISSFVVSRKMFKNLTSCKDYSLKELGIDD